MAQRIVTPEINATGTVRNPGGPRDGMTVTIHWSELGPHNELLYAVSLPDGSLTHIPAVQLT